jgi:hypothetical protein
MYTPAQGMTITFEMDADVIVYALKKMISFARENQYLFVANCAWWIAGITGLDSGLTIFIDNLETQKSVGQYRISMIPRDITKSESIDSGQIKLEESLTRNANKNPPPKVSKVTRSNPAERIQKLSRKERKRIAKAKRQKLSRNERKRIAKAK